MAVLVLLGDFRDAAACPHAVEGWHDVGVEIGSQAVVDYHGVEAEIDSVETEAENLRRMVVVDHCGSGVALEAGRHDKEVADRFGNRVADLDHSENEAEDLEIGEGHWKIVVGNPAEQAAGIVGVQRKAGY